MKVVFADSFGKSLKRLMWHESRVYKTYALFRYDIPHFFINIWRFRKVLWDYQWWDSAYMLQAMHASIAIMEKEYAKRKKNDNLSSSRLKGLIKMQRSLELLKHKLDDDYMDRAEGVLGELSRHPFEFEDVGNGCVQLIDKDTPEEKEQWLKTYKYSRDLEESEWTELWNILKGKPSSDYDEYIKENVGKYTQEQIDASDAYEDWRDGSDIRNWWS